MTPIEAVDGIWRDHQLGLERDVAIAAVRNEINVTDAGAAELLDHDARPSTRYPA